MSAEALSPAALAEVGRALAEAAGLSLSSGLEGTLRDGLAAAAAALGVPVAALAERVCARDPAALEALTEHAVVLETSFGRHPEQLALLGRALFGRPAPLAIWCAGCATGEEAYTVAIALREAGRDGQGDRILATDVSARALAAARAGAYGPWALRRLPPALLARHFEGEGVQRVSPEVRARVAFRRHNLVADPPPEGAWDAVMCRNVLIYFDPPTAAEVLYRLAGAVRPGGYLVLGPVELPLAAPLALEWVEDGGGTILRRPER